MFKVFQIDFAPASSAAAAVALVLMVVATPVAAGGLYDDSFYRPSHGKPRSIFRDPVGKLDKNIPRRLPKLTVPPSQVGDGVSAAPPFDASKVLPPLASSPARPAAPGKRAPLSPPAGTLSKPVLPPLPPLPPSTGTPPLFSPQAVPPAVPAPAVPPVAPKQ